MPQSSVILNFKPACQHAGVRMLKFVIIRLSTMLYPIIAFTIVLPLTGCINTEGTLDIKGKIIDNYTKTAIPCRSIIIQGLLESNEMLKSVNAGQFSTDSSGSFTYSLRKVKNARYYNFFLVGDSDYASANRKLGLSELNQHAKYLTFSLSKLVDLTIKVYRETRNPVSDTLSLYWESNGAPCWSLYPYKIEDYGKAKNYFGLPTWIGGNVNSTVKTRVFSDKRTKLIWELIRNGIKMENTDTITCRRDRTNIVYFTY
jgi:hypothetical protein